MTKKYKVKLSYDEIRMIVEALSDKSDILVRDAKASGAIQLVRLANEHTDLARNILHQVRWLYIFNKELRDEEHSS